MRALEGNRDGVWDWEVAPNKVFFSQRWIEMLGHDPDEISNELEEWDKRVHPDDKKQCYEDLERHFQRRDGIFTRTSTEFSARTELTSGFSIGDKWLSGQQTGNRPES